MRAVVTGGAGFIGSNLVDALLKRGDDVLVVDDLSSGRIGNLDGAKSAGGSKIRVLEKNICDPAILADFKSYRPETVFHLAAQMNVRRSVAEPAFDATSNVVGTVNLLEASQQTGVQRFIMASTGGAIYGEQETFPAPEEHRAQAECPYGVAKRCGELYLQYFARVHRIAGTALRYANVYGPRQNPKGEAGVVAIFIERLLSGLPLRINGDGLQTRDFVFVTDVVDANLRACRSEKFGECSIYNVGTGIESTVVDIAKILSADWKNKAPAAVRGKEVVIEHGPALPGEQRRSVIDASKIKRELGWEVTTSLEQGLGLTLDSFIAAAR